MVYLYCPLLLLLLCPSSRATLTPPLHQGVIVKVGQEVLQTIAEVISSKAEGELREASLEDETVDGKWTYHYWDMQFERLNLTPEVVLEKEVGRDALLLEGSVRGEVRVTARWRVKRRTWLGTMSASGGVVITSSGFSVTTRIVLGENATGVVGFTHDPTQCTMDLGNFDLDFSGRTSFILNTFVGFFKEELTLVLQKIVCLKINRSAGKAANELQTAVFDRYDYIPVLGHNIEINNRPWIITGGDGCAVVGALGQINMSLPEVPTLPGVSTPPFIPPTQRRTPAPAKETTEKREKIWISSSGTGTTSAPTGGLPGIQETKAPAEPSSSFTSTSPITKDVTRYARNLDRIHKRNRSVENVDLEAVPASRNRRNTDEEVDWCDVIPGGGVTVLITEEMISRLTSSLHRLHMIDYVATQWEGDVFEQVWGGRPAGTIQIPLSTHALLADYKLQFKIVSTAAPTITLDPSGIAVLTPLRARVLLSRGPLNIKLELHLSVRFHGLCRLTQVDGIYRLVPELSSQVEVERHALQIFGVRGSAMGVRIAEQVETRLNAVLAESLPGLIRGEIRDGLPLNIPSNLVIEQAEVVYREDYIMVTAQDVRVVFQD